MIVISANILVILCRVGYNELKVVSSIFFLSIYPILVLLPQTVILSIVVIDVVFTGILLVHYPVCFP